METEEPATTDNVDNFEKEPSEKQMNEEAPEEVNGNEYIEEPTEEERELREKLNTRLERESQLLSILQYKEKQVKNLAKKYEKLKEDLWTQTKNNRQAQTEVKIDLGLVREISVMKDKIAEKSRRLELAERELETHNRSQAEMDKMYHQRFKNMEELQNYMKLSNENPHLETYLRSEYFKGSLDKIQALKQLAEQLSFEVERATVIKNELEEDKGKYDAYLKQIRTEFKKLQDENERLAEEADRRKNSL